MRKRMSLRAIARMKQENRELKNELATVKHGGHIVAKLTLSCVEDAKIQTAQLLGYVTILRDNGDGTFRVAALKLERAG